MNRSLVNEKERRSDALKRLGFTAYQSWNVASSSIPNQIRGRVVWRVISSGKRSTLFRFFFLKWLFDELTSSEIKYVLDLPEFHSRQGAEFFACMKMLANGFSKTEIRTRLNSFRKITGLQPHKPEQYRSLKQIKFFLQEVELREPPTKKYSGWARHHNDKGGLGLAVLTDPEPHSSYISEEIDLYSILSVGKVVVCDTELTLSLNDWIQEDPKQRQKR